MVNSEIKFYRNGGRVACDRANKKDNTAISMYSNYVIPHEVFDAPPSVNISVNIEETIQRFVQEQLSQRMNEMLEQILMVEPIDYDFGVKRCVGVSDFPMTCNYWSGDNENEFPLT